MQDTVSTGAAELTSLAGWIDEQLGDETADRQWIAESAAAKVRDITLQMLGVADLARRPGPADDWEPDADPRIRRAREFLAIARTRTVDALPPSVMMREDAELRRQLDQVLDVIDAAPHGIIVAPRPDSEKGWAKARLLAALPVAAEPGGQDDAFATVLADRDDDLCDVVTGWLRKGRGVPGPDTAASGPFETEQQARELPAVRAAYDAAHASTRRGVMGERNHRLLDEACTAAEVELGAYDHRIILWLAGWEPQTCTVVAGLITRAAAGRDGAR